MCVCVCVCVCEFHGISDVIVVCYMATPLFDVSLGGYKHGAREI